VGSGILVASCERPFLVSYFLDKKRKHEFVYVPLDRKPDIYLAITRWNSHQLIDGKVVHTVERKGVPLSYVIAAEGGYHPERSRKPANP